MTVPLWLLWLIIAEEFALLLAFAWNRQWVDVIYWTGVQVINTALLLRAYGYGS
jgi:hypothetical protein